MPKVAKFSLLADGDLAPGSRSVPRDVLRHFAEMKMLPTWAHAVPTFEGAVAIGWRKGEVEYTAEILPGDRLFMCTDNTATDDLDEVEVDFHADVLKSFLDTGAWH